jgi:hypothetical protein
MSGAFGSSQWMYASGAAGGGFYPYSIDQSLRFEESDTPSLSRTQTSGTTTTWTFSAWVKRSRLDSVSQTGGVAGQDPIFCVGDANTDDMLIYFHQHSTADRLDIIIRDSSTIRAQLTTTRLFRDVAAFYHIQVTCDFTNATQGDRLRLYVNGVRETVFDTETYPSDTSQVTVVNNSSYTARIGQLRTAASYFAGYMAEVHLVDGSALEPTSFGEFSNGVWIPVRYSGGHGTAGWYLPFDDGAALGDDESANTNDFSTVVGLAASDVVPDSPNNIFATFNVLDRNLYNAPSEGNLRALTAGNNGTQAVNFAVSSGKWYFEVRNGTAGSATLARLVGIIYDYAKISGASYNDSNKFVYYSGTGNIRNNSNVAYGDSWDALGDIIGVALDMDNGAIYFSKNGTWQNSATAAEIAAGTTTNAAFTGLSGTFKPIVAKTGGTSSNDPHDANFGQNPSFNGNLTGGDVGTESGDGNALFKYAPPTGFLALCSANLPEPTIGPNSEEQADDYFNTVLYTGDGSTSNAITGVGFQPDWTWIKERDAAVHHYWFDTVRGATKNLHSSLNTGTGEATDANSLTSFDSDGFTVGTDGAVNGLDDLYVAWNWKLGGSSNTFNIDDTGYATASAAGLDGGDINPDGASISTTAGVSIVTYTGNGSSDQTIQHGLASVPLLTIIKDRDNNGSNDNWWFGSSLVGEKYFYFTTAAPTGSTAVVLPTSGDDTTITIARSPTNATNTNQNTHDFIMYNFHSVEGFSKVGKYITNNSSDGSFVWTGFRPKFVMIKRTDGTVDWQILDTKRNTFNPMNEVLEPNQTNSTSTSTSTVDFFADFLSNGFKLRGNGSAANGGTNATVFYIAFAENPFKYANAR